MKHNKFKSIDWNNNTTGLVIKATPKRPNVKPRNISITSIMQKSIKGAHIGMASPSSGEPVCLFFIIDATNIETVYSIATQKSASDEFDNINATGQSTLNAMVKSDAYEYSIMVENTDIDKNDHHIQKYWDAQTLFDQCTIEFRNKRFTNDIDVIIIDLTSSKHNPTNNEEPSL